MLAFSDKVIGEGTEVGNEATLPQGSRGGQN